MASLAASEALLNSQLGNDEAAPIIEALKEEGGDFTKAQVKLGAQLAQPILHRARLIHSLARFYASHPNIVTGLLNKTGDASSLQDVALDNSQADLTELATLSQEHPQTEGEPQIDGHGPNTSIAPKSLAAGPRETSKSAAQREALSFRRRLFGAEPTAVLRRMIADDEAGPFLDESIRDGATAFLANQPPTFNIRKDSLLRASQNPESFKGISADQQKPVVQSLQSIQRVQALTTAPEAIGPVLKAGFSSAFHISSIPQSQFIRQMNAEENVTPEIAKQIHENAVNSRIQNDHALTTMLQTVRGTGIAALDGVSTMEDRTQMLQTQFNSTISHGHGGNDASKKPKPTVDLAAMFGSLDYCECSDCNSINSPAAYFVELLEFLRNNNLHWDKTKWKNSGEEGIAGTTLEKLFARRPDLGCIELTCENTNTVLPYIDLANEVMESFVVHQRKYEQDGHDPKRATIDVFNVEDETTSELLSMPQHTNYNAYCILNTAVYPIVNAPYHQALDEARIFLENIGTSRYELLRYFPPSYRSHSGTSQADGIAFRAQHEITIRRAATCEFFLMTPLEYIAITKQHFWAKGFWELKKKREFLDEEYHKDINRKTAWEYWGYDTRQELLDTTEATALGLRFVKKQFLPRAQISYVDLVDLVKTRYINPNFPTGRDKVILDSIHFSYKYLATLVKPKARDPWHKWGALVKFLLNWQPWARRQGVTDVPCGLSLSKKEIFCWLKAWFEPLGQLIVLESGDGPRLPVAGPVVEYTPPPPPPDPEVPRIRLAVAAPKVKFDPWATGAKIEHIGDLERSGLIKKNDIVIGSVAADGTVLDASQYKLMDSHQGKLLLVLSPSVVKFDKPSDLNVNQIVAYVTEDSSLLAWPETVPTSSSTTEAVEPKLIHYLAATETCNIDGVRLKHLDGSSLTCTEWDRAQAFLRLWRKLGWTINEVDRALEGLAPPPDSSVDDPGDSSGSESITDWGQIIDKPCPTCSCAVRKQKCNCNGPHTPEEDEDCCDVGGPGSPLEITPEFLDQLVAIKEIISLTGVDLMQLLTLWTTISVEGNPSLYSKLFLIHSVYAIDDVFKPDDDGNFLTNPTTISGHLPVIRAALKAKADDLSAIVTYSKVEDDLTLENISKLYSYTVLARMLRIKLPLVPQIIDLCGDAFSNAQSTLDILKLWQQIQDHGFTLSQMNYLILGTNDPLRPIGPTLPTVLKATKTMLDGLKDIETENADVEEADLPSLTADILTAKVSLIFDPTIASKVVGILNGTNVYTTNAPANLTLAIPDGLAAKLKYQSLATTTPPRANVSITGILTADETAAAKALASQSGWSEAIDRLAKQPIRFFDENLFGIFSNEGEAKSKLLAGDIPPPPPAQSSTGNPTQPAPPPPVDNSTAGPKTLYFLRGFLPFLRKELSKRLIVSSVSGPAGISSPELTDVLLTQVVFIGDDESPAMQVLAEIHKPSTFSESSFNGYLIPASTDAFTFVCGGFDEEPAPLVIDGKPIRLSNRQEDPNDVWFSDLVPLTNGQLYPLVVSDQPASNLQWKTARSPVASIPSASLLPENSSSTTMDVFVKLFKVGLVIKGFDLSIDELKYFIGHSADFSDLELANVKIPTWTRLANYSAFRDSLPNMAIKLIDFFKWIETRKDATQLADQIHNLTNWKADIVSKLISRLGLTLASFKNEIALVTLQKLIEIQTKVAVDPELLFKWADTRSYFWEESRRISEAIRNNVRSRYDVDTWEKIAQPLFDRLRRNQRDALIAYLLVQEPLKRWGVIDADGLFEFFLIDVQMGSCLQTSRIKQAISTVQLYVQRCLLNLEKEYNVVPSDIDQDRWNWMNGYRLWEANRKVFLWPENWLDPTLRDDKSEIFQTLEAKLLQKDVSAEAVRDGIKNYLASVDQVANLEVLGLLVDPPKNPERVHIFAKTQSAPYFFFYRVYMVKARNWMPWETMQVDITTYEQEDKNGIVYRTGSYLLPIVWNGRLLVFIPQITKKTLPAQQADGETSVVNLGNKKTKKATPISYWEFKMGWSEYRNRKWTQKKVTTSAIAKIPTINPSAEDPPTLPPISGYQFVPMIEGTEPLTRVVVGVFQNDKTAIGSFAFDGSNVWVRDSSGTSTFKLESEMTTEFMYRPLNTERQIHSYQDVVELTGTPPADQPLDLVFKNPYVGYSFTNPQQPRFFGPSEKSSGSSSEHNFYHAHARMLLALSSSAPSIDSLFRYMEDIKTPADRADPFGGIEPSVKATPSSDYHELKTPYALYNWELALHAPMLLMNKLFSVQLFDEALQVAHYVFNPFADRSSAPLPGDLWRFPPFKNVLPESALEKTFAQLDPNTPVSADNVINEWRNNPFAPHVVARGRRQAYMKWFAIQYIKILVAYGDKYFTQNTLESIPYAIQLYVRAAHLYGPRGQKIPRRGKKKVETYKSLLNQWDGFSNAVTQMELMFPFSNQSDASVGQLHGKNVLANIFGFATSRYFCIPNNPELTAVRDLIDDRLYKIRHCQDINGVVRQLPLFEPPLDPGLLVQAAAAGISFASVLSDLNAPMPNYRFPYLMQKALELCNELKSTAGAFLAAKEKLDSEQLAQIHGQQETSISNLMMEMKKLNLEEANRSMAALENSRLAPQYRLRHFITLIGGDLGKIVNQNTDFSELENRMEALIQAGSYKLVGSEKLDMDKAESAADHNSWVGEVEALSGYLHMIPTSDIAAQPWGMGINTKWGPQSFAHAAAATARKMKIKVDDLSAEGANAARMTSFLRQLQERVYQANVAGYEITNADKQINVQKQKMAIAEQDITQAQQVIDNAKETLDFLKSKYSNDILYSWMENSLRGLYYQTYTLAYQLAKKAERAYQFERGLDPSDSSFISFGYWDANRDGLLASERLYLSLKQLETAYQSDRGYDYEITKNISLRQVAPLALLNLRELGSCEVVLPELLFDMDFPGHYSRRIKSVSLTFPCVVGPYTSISCTARLLESEYRTSSVATSGSDYPRGASGDSDDGADLRFRNPTAIPISAIAVSSAQNDSGLFELNFRDERYVPFEGAGAISKWRLELPTHFRSWDYGTLSDVVFTVRYTSREGGERLRTAAAGAVKAFVESIGASSQDSGLFAVFDLRADFAGEWAKAVGPPQQPASGGASEPRKISLRDLQDRLPAFTRPQDGSAKGSRVQAVSVWVYLNKGSWVSGLNLIDGTGTSNSLNAEPALGGSAVWSYTDLGAEVGSWELELTGDGKEKLRKGWLVVRYALQ